MFSHREIFSWNQNLVEINVKLTAEAGFCVHNIQIHPQSNDIGESLKFFTKAITNVVKALICIVLLRVHATASAL